MKKTEQMLIVRLCLICVWVFFGLSIGHADDPWQSPAAAAAGLPRFQHVGIVLDPATLQYNPSKENGMMPSVVRTDRFPKPLGKYYMYYSPHNGPGGICLSYADKLEGPWKEYIPNPIISNDWPPHYQTSHVAGPDAIWIEEEQKLFVYYHGPNRLTRFASSTDGIHFTYEGVATTAGDYARVQRYTIPGKDNRYIMMFIKGSSVGLALSKDARKWEVRPEPLVDLVPNTRFGTWGAGSLAPCFLMPWNGKHYVVYHCFGERTDLHVSEVDAALEKSTYLGLFYPCYAVGLSNQSVMSANLFTEGDQLYMFVNGGQRLNCNVVLAVAPATAPQAADLSAKKKLVDSYFASWPEGKAPEEIGSRLIEEFLNRDIPPTRSVLCPEALAWVGGLKLTRAPGHQALNDRLVQKALYLQSTEGQKTFSQEARPEARALGAMLNEIFLQTRQWRFQLYGCRMADAQWGKPKEGGVTQEARYWADDLFLIGLLQAQAYRATVNPAYLEHCGLLAKVYLEKLQKPNGLLAHALQSPVAWGRGNGMAAAGLAEILHVLPEEHPQRPAILAGFQKLMKALLECQGANGLWKQVIDKPESWDETSGSGLITYAMVTGVKEGWLDGATYGPAARKAWLALTDRINDKNQVRDVCVGTYAAFSQVGGDMEKQYTYYLKRPRVVGDLHGQAPMLWTACALLR